MGRGSKKRLQEKIEAGGLFYYKANMILDESDTHWLISWTSKNPLTGLVWEPSWLPKIPKENIGLRLIDEYQKNPPNRADAILGERFNKYRIRWKPNALTGVARRPSWEPKYRASDQLVATWVLHKSTCFTDLIPRDQYQDHEFLFHLVDEKLVTSHRTRNAKWKVGVADFMEDIVQPKNVHKEYAPKPEPVQPARDPASRFSSPIPLSSGRPSPEPMLAGTDDVGFYETNDPHPIFVAIYDDFGKDQEYFHPTPETFKELYWIPQASNGTYQGNLVLFHFIVVSDAARFGWPNLFESALAHLRDLVSEPKQIENWFLLANKTYGSFFRIDPDRRGIPELRATMRIVLGAALKNLEFWDPVKSEAESIGSRPPTESRWIEAMQMHDGAMARDMQVIIDTYDRVKVKKGWRKRLQGQGMKPTPRDKAATS